MKPFQIAIGIAGVALMFIGAIAIKSKLDYDKEGREITRLIGEFKAMGVPTNGEEYFHPIPDSQNAWVDIKPMFTKELINGNKRYPFDSQLPKDFIVAAQLSDLPTLNKYLAVNRQKRELILRALEAKPKLQIHLDLDLGIDIRDSGFQNIRNLQNELCLAALSSAIEDDRAAMFRDLKAIMRLISFDFESGEYASNRVGIEGRYTFSRTLYRIVELCPQLAKPVEDFYFTQPPIAKTNCQNIVEAAFLRNIATIRYYDVPGMDRSKPLFQIGEHDEPDPTIGGSAKHDDYVPKSPAVRSYLANRLQKWLPFVAHQRSKSSPTSLPDVTDIDSIQEPSQGDSRRYIDVLKGASELNFGSENVIRSLSRNEQIEITELLLFKAIEIRRKTGSFPRTIAETGIGIEAYACLGGAEFTSSNNTFSISGKRLNESGSPTVTTSFPLADSISKSSLESAQKRLKDFAAGKLGSDGFEISRSGVGGPGSAPRGAPGP